jgi:hypothetical protein
MATTILFVRGTDKKSAEKQKGYGNNIIDMYRSNDRNPWGFVGNPHRYLSKL